MKSFYFDNGFEIITPVGWEEEKDNNLVSLYNAVDGIGALQFSFYQVDNSDSIDLCINLKRFLSDKHNPINVEMMDNYAYSNAVDDGGIYWRYWLFLKSPYLAFASYNCDDIHKDKEMIVINDIMKSIL
ncbi:MAG: hypothetical protein EOO93_08220 [Pedobacter sp.]|nr:MAG: hypothetical protein EOO93_08220 [Pedobacter sp.]